MDGDPAAGLIGRDAECALVAAALAADRPVWVVGEPGIGKTTLVRAVAGRSGRRLHEGSGFATLGPVPYHALPRAIAAIMTGDAEQRASALERAVGPDILFVDDAQWADHESGNVLTRLAGRIAVIVASREEPFGDLAALPWVRVEVSELDDTSAAAVARRARPGLSAARLDRIVARAAGNPLIAEELARDGSESPTIRRSMALRLDGLPADQQHLLWLLALAGRPVAVTRLPEGIGALVARGLTTVRDGEAQVRHALLRDAILPLIPECERSALLRELAGLLEDPMEVAAMLLEAGDAAAALAIAEPALTDAPLPRRAALLEIVAAGAVGLRADAYRLDAARAYRDLGEDAAVVRLLRPPMDGDEEIAAWRHALLGESLWSIGEEAEAKRVLQEADHRWPPETAGQLELIRALARQLVYTGHPGEALALLDNALAITGVQSPTYRLAGLRAAVALFAGRAAAVGLLRDAWAEARDAGDHAATSAAARHLHNGLLLEVGAADAAAFARAEGERLSIAGLPALGTPILVEAVQSLTLAGGLADAIEVGDRLLERPAAAVFRQRAVLYFARALVLAGRFEEAAQVRHGLQAPFSNATQEADRLDEAAEAAYWEGRTRRCLELSAGAAALPRETELNLILPALVRAWAQVDAGLRPDPIPPAPPLPCLAGAGPEAEGLARATDDPAAARGRFEEAATLWGPFMAPREAVCRWAAGACARRAGHADAPDLLRAALHHAVAMGFEPVAARVRRSLRLTGEPVARHSRGSRGSLPLTDREREVLDLVGRGLTNREIARQMGLGRPTVAQALSRAMARLGVDSRAQAVTAAGARPTQPLVVVDDRPGAAVILEGVRADLVRSGWEVVDGFEGGVGPRAVLAGIVNGDQAAAAALLAALDGRGLLVLASCGDDTRHRLLMDLGRVGPVTHHAAPAESGRAGAALSDADVPGAIGAQGLALLALVAEGHSVGEAATRLGISRRTADRHLGAARAVLHATTTAGAVGEATRRGWLVRAPA